MENCKPCSPGATFTPPPHPPPRKRILTFDSHKRGMLGCWLAFSGFTVTVKCGTNHPGGNNRWRRLSIVLPVRRPHKQSTQMIVRPLALSWSSNWSSLKKQNKSQLKKKIGTRNTGTKPGAPADVPANVPSGMCLFPILPFFFFFPAAFCPFMTAVFRWNKINVNFAEQVEQWMADGVIPGG